MHCIRTFWPYYYYYTKDRTRYNANVEKTPSSRHHYRENTEFAFCSQTRNSCGRWILVSISLALLLHSPHDIVMLVHIFFAFSAIFSEYALRTLIRNHKRWSLHANQSLNSRRRFSIKLIIQSIKTRLYGYRKWKRKRKV